MCSRVELTEDYCQEFGRKMKVLCIYGTDKEKEKPDFRACTMTAEDEQGRVIVFQLLVGVLGGLAYYGVQIRKQKTATLFEQRARNQFLRGNRGDS